MIGEYLYRCYCKYHPKPLTIGQLIDILESIEDKTLYVVFDNAKYYPVRLSSYRYDYTNLAFEYECDGLPMTVKDILLMLKDGISNKTFEGYKGGKYTMNRDTTLWVANWGTVYGYVGGCEQQAVVEIDIKKDKIVLLTQCLA